ncbi:hypothetical protein M408DRAFT_331435 [Serendipita vermifera MAFF 305830]|uniref:Origin recognition complex subunit 5 C-terminal domain-containing protein n=1 Tax=Serendipita vermifera MAFF 305830 TaxID=933852 RepID=A0A0C3AY81_SERVB|nr:hypothetical protein M408DRAFT_331435 [Serendipita vermifera MAFF 305830]
MAEAALAGVLQRWPGRESLASTLFSFWTTSPPACVHICDPTTAQGTAKMFPELLKAAHEATDTPRIFSVQLDATECISSKLVFDRILNGLADWTPSWEDGAQNWAPASGERHNHSLDAFVHGLRALYQERLGIDSQQQANMIIFISFAERLRESVPTLINPLTRLADLTSLPISVVFLSQLTWEEIKPAIRGTVIPYIITLSPLTASETTATLKLRFGEVADDTCINPFHPVLQPIFDSFTELVYGICSPYTQDPIDISYILATHWALYISPIINDWNDFNDREEEYEIPAQAQARLNAIFRQSIGASVQSLYPRLVDSETWLSQGSEADYNIRFSEADRNTVLQRRKEMHEQGSLNVTRLPLMARYLLVASYLASFNPTSMDVRILSQVRDPTKKFRKIGPRKVRPGTALKIGHLLSGPGTFTFDRLWAVSGALVEVFGSNEKPPWASSLTDPGMFSEAEVTRVQFFAQIESLVTRRLLVRTTPQEKLESQALFRCAISMEQASESSDSLGFKLGPLLYEEQQ